MKNFILSLSIALFLAPFTVALYASPSGFSFDQNVKSGILYAVDGSSQAEMLEGLKKVDVYLARHNINEESGNPCFFFRENPYCNVGKWYQDRIAENITKLETQTLDEMGLRRVKDSLTEQVDGTLSAEIPSVLKEMVIARGDINLARIISFSGVLCFLAVCILVFVLSLLGS